jgi:hypothetical protein
MLCSANNAPTSNRIRIRVFIAYIVFSYNAMSHGEVC